MEDSKVKISITQGDVNGVEYEVILKTFIDPVMLELCTPVIYGSPRVIACHRRSLGLSTNFNITSIAAKAVHNRLDVVNYTDDEVKAEFSKPDPRVGKAALRASEEVVEELRERPVDIIVAAPTDKHVIQSERFASPGYAGYIERCLGNSPEPLMVLMKGDFRMALVTNHTLVREMVSLVTKELIQEKLAIFNCSLRQGFGISTPRIVVLALSPHVGDDGLLSTEKQEIISPVIQKMAAKGISCYSPYPADGFMESGNFTHFDGVLTVYRDQEPAPFKTLTVDGGVNYTVGLSVIRASLVYGIVYDIVGKGVVCEDLFR